MSFDNKNISIWRGNLPPPTRAHLWLKDDGKLYRFDKTWISFFDDATTEHSGLMTKTDKQILVFLNNNLHWA